MYLQFLQLQQLPSACFPRRVTWWLRNVHVSNVTTWRSQSISTRCGRRCGSGRRSRRCAWSDFFFGKLPSMSSLVSCLLTLRLHLNDCDFDSRPLFLVSLSTLTHTHIYILLLQPIPLGLTFSNDVSKLKAQNSNISFHWNVEKDMFELKNQTSLWTETWKKRRSSFELWAFENDTPSGIGCIIVYYISWYWQNRHQPEFRLKRLLDQWHNCDTLHRSTNLFVSGWLVQRCSSS